MGRGVRWERVIGTLLTRSPCVKKIGTRNLIWRYQNKHADIKIVLMEVKYCVYKNLKWRFL